VIVVGLRLGRHAVEIRLGHGVQGGSTPVHAQALRAMPYIHGMNTLSSRNCALCFSIFHEHVLDQVLRGLTVAGHPQQ